MKTYNLSKTGQEISFSRWINNMKGCGLPNSTSALVHLGPLYCAVRKTEGEEWVEIDTWGYVMETPVEKAQKTDKQIPHWAKVNPVVRIAKFKLTEIRNGA